MAIYARVSSARQKKNETIASQTQVEPFLIGGGPQAVRLFTTRDRSVFPASTQPVVVDEMDQAEAQRLLTTGIDGVSGRVQAGLLAATGRWPVLLRLVNAAVCADQHAGRRAEELRARETNLRDQIEALDAQLTDRHAYLALATDLEGFLTQLHTKAETSTTDERRRVLKLRIKDVLIGPDKITIRTASPSANAPTPTPNPTTPTRRAAIPNIAQCVGGV